MTNNNKTYKKMLFTNRNDWRAWLLKNNDKSGGIWMTYYKKHTGKKSIPYNDAVEEALCFGWIDSLVKKLDEEKYIQKYTPRKDKSIWSQLNKKRVEKMINEGRMTEFGMKKINEARKNGYWNKLVEVDNPDKVPEDFNEALLLNQKANEYFKSLSPSNKKMYLWWILNAKRQETKSKRIKETVKNYLKEKNSECNNQGMNIIVIMIK